jgi:phage terminase small subunit
MPRRSRESMSVKRVDGSPDRIRPPSNLPAAEAALWREIVTACDARHFVPSDAPLLVEYCRATVQAQLAGHELAEHGAVIDGKCSPWLVAQEK